MSAHDFAARGPLDFARMMSRGKGGHRREAKMDELERLVALRHMAGGGPHGGGPFDRPFGGGRGRKRRGDVRTALLLLLAEEPRNGYQLMQTIEERSDGRWRPSPGSVYPTLAQLEDEGLIRADGARRPEGVRDHRHGTSGDRRPRGRAGPLGERR